MLVRIEIVGPKWDQTRITYLDGSVRVFGRRMPEYPASGYYQGGEWVAPLMVGRPAIENLRGMKPRLRAELVRLGWNPQTVVWGERVSGSPGHVEYLTPTGVKRTEFGPATTVGPFDGQIAIVRWN